jgi:hypothetical protein
VRWEYKGNKLTNVIAEYQPELKSGIPRIIELLTDSDNHAQSILLDTIKALVERGK